MAINLHRSWSLDLDLTTFYELLKLRVEVFVVEQKCAYPELDGRDLEPETRQLWLEEDGRVICTLRLLEEHGDGGKTFRIGRLCTAAPYRGKGLTKRLLEAALAEVGTVEVVIDAQSHLVEMYAAHDFVPDGEEFLEDGIAHIPMRRPGGLAGFPAL